MQTGEPLEVRVASISAEIAAAIAQAQQPRALYDDDDEEEDEDEESGSGQEIGAQEMIGPNTSGIRGLGTDMEAVHAARVVLGEIEEDDDSDAFPMPLRTRRSKELVALAGVKRKR